jgi:hypothetical protein
MAAYFVVLSRDRACGKQRQRGNSGKIRKSECSRRTGKEQFHAQALKPRKKELVQYYAGKNSTMRMCPSGLTRKPAAQKSQPDIRVQREHSTAVFFLIQRRNFESASTSIPGALNPRYRVPRSETADSLKRSAQQPCQVLRTPSPHPSR